MWFSAGGDKVQAAFEAALAWCGECCVVTEAPSAAQQGDGFWQQLGLSAERVRAAMLTDLEGADSALLGPLYAAGRVRRFTEPRQGHFMWFERGEALRLLVAPAALQASTLSGHGLWFFWEGVKNALPEGLQAELDAALSASTPTDEIPSSAIPMVPYSRMILSVREVLGIRNARDYLELEESDRELALWSALIGEGPVDLEQAIRLCAERLRAQSFLDYQRLHQDGRVYTSIEERLLAARRRTDLFDRPRSGFVRAIQRELDHLTAEQWRDCLMGALDEGVHVDRDEAVRLGFENAQLRYGINAQRLRVGGRADQALRSAINSAVRQGYLQRDGAAYLVRIAPEAEPTQRGAIAPEAAEEVTVTPAPEPASEPIPPLGRDVQTLQLPIRALNWCARKEVTTVRELVAWSPEVFESEKNIGRSTVRETREVLETLLGCSWEEAHVAANGGVATPGNPTSGATAEDEAAADALTAGGATGWAQLASHLNEEERAAPLLDVRLPTRMKNYVRAEGIERLGELFKLPYASLVGTAHLGRKSLNDAIDATREYLAERAAPPAPPPATFLQAWQAQLGVLEPIPRMIVTRRAGMHGERETLEELGAMLGVSRERVRQIEARVLERLADRSRWRRLVEASLVTAFGSARALPLDLLAQDAWWSAIDQHELLLDYVVRRIFEDQLFVLEAPSGRRYLTKFGPNDFVLRLEAAKTRVAKLEYPVEASVIDDILRSEADALDPVLLPELRQAVDELLLRDPARPSLALGYGRFRANDVIAFLNGQPEPVHVDVLEAQCGRGSLPEEVLYFKRGYVGLKRHFPDFDAWSERLVPAALEVMQERPAGRQWLVPEIHEALRERGLVPDWLGHWHLASLLRLSGQVDYLGRLRVTLKDSGVEARVQYVELLQGALESAGAPLSFADLLASARQHSDITEATAALRVASPPFVRVDDTRIGLVERDIPGGPKAVAAAVEAVVRALTESQLGLTPHRATLLINGISETLATWTRPLVTSVLRSESTIRIDRTRNIGLEEWDDSRCPTRPELMRREVQQAGGSLSLSQLYASMESFYGRAPDRGTLGVMAQQVGLTIVGDSILRAADTTPESVERVGINLSGIPTELREMFQDLVQQPIPEPVALRAQVQQHVDEIAQAHEVNEFVDLPGARTLAQQCETLLDRWTELALSDRHLAHAAVSYFVSWDDVTNDLGVGGLDDDKQIMNAVMAYLGIEENRYGAMAS